MKIEDDPRYAQGLHVWDISKSTFITDTCGLCGVKAVEGMTPGIDWIQCPENPYKYVWVVDW